MSLKPRATDRSHLGHYRLSFAAGATWEALKCHGIDEECDAVSFVPVINHYFPYRITQANSKKTKLSPTVKVTVAAALALAERTPGCMKKIR